MNSRTECVNVDLKMNSYLAVISTGAFLGNADYLSHKTRMATNTVAEMCNRLELTVISASIYRRDYGCR